MFTKLSLFVSVASLASCGNSPNVPGDMKNSSSENTDVEAAKVAITTGLGFPPGGCATNELPASVVKIDGVSMPCALTVARGASGFSANGDCAVSGAPGSRILTVTWSRPTTPDVVLGLLLHSIEVPAEGSAILPVDTASGAPPKTEAGATETSSEKTRFDCERDGTSNYAEFCVGTLACGG